MFGAYGRAVSSTCITFVSQVALEREVPKKLDLQRRVVAVELSQRKKARSEIERCTSEDRGRSGNV